MRKIHIYIIGVMLFGLSSEYVKSSIQHGAVFLLASVAYLVLLRLLAGRFGTP